MNNQRIAVDRAGGRQTVAQKSSAAFLPNGFFTEFVVCIGDQIP